MSAPEDRLPWSGEAGAERLYALVQDACAGRRGLPARLEAGLRVTFETLASEPELACKLALRPYLDTDATALDAQRGWLRRFGRLLGDAVASDPRATAPDLDILAASLIGGVRFQIARLVTKGEGSALPRLLPGTLETLLTYYFDPGEPGILARAALGGPR